MLCLEFGGRKRVRQVRDVTVASQFINQTDMMMNTMALHKSEAWTLS